MILRRSRRDTGHSPSTLWLPLATVTQAKPQKRPMVRAPDGGQHMLEGPRNLGDVPCICRKLEAWQVGFIWT